MKVVTWNANMAFRKKQKIILDTYNPDLLIIQECEHPSKFDEIIYPYYLWTGENKNKGLGIFSKHELEEINVKPMEYKYNIPFKVKDYTVIGIWAMNDKVNRKNRYIGQVYNILNKNIELLDENVMIIGDFNWNIIFDENPSYPLSGNLTEVIESLRNYNIKSAYNRYHREDFGLEKKPTLFMYRDTNKPYHVDYIFVKDDIKYKELIIGQHADWIAHSDHMPIFIDIT